MEDFEKDAALFNTDVVNINRPRANTTMTSRKTRLGTMMTTTTSSPSRNRIGTMMSAATSSPSRNRLGTMMTTMPKSAPELSTVNEFPSPLTSGLPRTSPQLGRSSIATQLIRPSTMQSNMKPKQTVTLSAIVPPAKTISTTLVSQQQRPKTHHHNNSNDNDSDSQSIGSIHFSSDAGSEVGNNRRKSKASEVLDFYRVCSLCEKRFPRDAIDKKILKKHLIDLRYLIYNIYNKYELDLVYLIFDIIYLISYMLS